MRTAASWWPMNACTSAGVSVPSWSSVRKTIMRADGSALLSASSARSVAAELVSLRSTSNRCAVWRRQKSGLTHSRARAFASSVLMSAAGARGAPRCVRR